MNLITKIGLWFDRRFPEKISAEEAYNLFEGQQALMGLIKSTSDDHDVLLKQLHGKIQTLESDNDKLKVEIEKVKSTLVIRSRTAPNYAGNMNPGSPIPVGK